MGTSRTAGARYLNVSPDSLAILPGARRRCVFFTMMNLGWSLAQVAHLTSRDYAKVPADLVALGFVPPDKEQAILETECVDVLTEVYSQFAGGGGAAKIDVNFVITQLTGLSEKYGNLFQVPPYFAYIARAFGVLEGTEHRRRVA